MKINDMERKTGYYWVLDKGGQDWYIARWDGKYWELPGNELDFSDRDFFFITDTPLQCPELTVLDIRRNPLTNELEILVNTSKNKPIE
jgi:hypothetical protein